MFSKHFVTYGDRSFNIQKKRIRYQANQLNFFDEIHVFSQKDISKEFKLKFKNVFNDELGGGYWIWKIYILDLMLKKTKVSYQNLESVLGVQKLFLDLKNDDEKEIDAVISTLQDAKRAVEMKYRLGRMNR